MPSDNTLQLVIQADTGQANKNVDQFNRGLSNIEKTASQGASGAAKGFDSITASMLKGVVAGNLLTDAIRAAVDWAKEWTVGAAEYAAHTEKISLSMDSLAKAHGISTNAAKAAVQTIKQVGFGTQDAVHAVDRLVISNIGLEKAQGLAKLAKDAAAIENITPGEALEKLLLSVESGASRGLRSMGLFLDLNKMVENQEKLTGKTLSEKEKVDLRLNAVMREGTKIQGAAAAGAETAEAKFAALKRKTDDLKDAVGKKFQDQLVNVAGDLSDLADWAIKNKDAFVGLGEAALGLSAAFLAANLAFKIGAIGSAIGKMLPLIGVLRTALSGLAGTLSIAATAGAGVFFGLNWLFGDKKPVDQAAESIKNLNDQLRKTPSWWIERGLTPPKGKLDGLLDYAKTATPVKPAKHELTEEEKARLADLAEAGRKQQGEAARSAREEYLQALTERKNAEHEVAKQRIEDSMRIVESTKSEAAAAKASIAVLVGTQEEYAAGVAKIREEAARIEEQKSTRVDEKTGGLIHIKLLDKTLSDLRAATAEKLHAFEIQFQEEQDRRLQSMVKALGERIHELSEKIRESWVKQFQHWRELDDLDDETRDLGLQTDKSGIEQRKNLELAGLGEVDAYTIQDKIALERRKTAIEADALRARTSIELREIDIRTQKRVDDYEEAHALDDPGQIKEITDKFRAIGQAQKDALQTATGSELDLAAVKQAAEAKKLVEDQYRSIFDTLKQEAGGVFDALLHKSTSVWQAIGNTFKNAMLTAIKEVISSRVAAMLTELVTGQKVSFARNGNGVLGGVLGTVPVFAGAAGIASAAGATGGGASVPSIAAAAGLPGILGAAGIPGLGPGGTPPFLPSSGGGFGGGALDGGGVAGGAAAAGGGGNPLGSVISGATKFGLGGLKGGFKNALGNLNQFVGGAFHPGNTVGLAGNLSQLGHSNAAALAGGVLGLDGLKRGGYLGMAEDTAGGALLGYKFGGPLGAAIGAGIGAAAGAIRLIWEAPVAEAKRLVKQIYGVNIDTKMAQQIVDLAKQKYSGHVSIAVRDPDIRKMLELYAAGTGQKVPISAASPHAGSLVEQNGSLYQASTYLYGQAYNYQSNLPTIGGGAAGQWPSGPMSLQINVGGQGAGQFVAGQVVTPDFVQAQWQAANSASNGRTGNSAMLQQPGLVIA